MTFRIPYVPRPMSPEESLEGEKRLQQIHDQWKREQARMKLAREQQLALQARDAEAARIEAGRIANLPTPDTTEYPVQKLKWINGKVVPPQEESPSIAVSRIATLTEMNQAALQKK